MRFSKEAILKILPYLDDETIFSPRLLRDAGFPEEYVKLKVRRFLPKNKRLEYLMFGETGGEAKLQGCQALIFV